MTNQSLISLPKSISSELAEKIYAWPPIARIVDANQSNGTPITKIQVNHVDCIDTPRESDRIIALNSRVSYMDLDGKEKSYGTSIMSDAACVLVFFRSAAKEATEYHVLLTQQTRVSFGDKARPEISGGLRDASDGSIKIAALRELEEESGVRIALDRLLVFKQLTSIGQHPAISDGVDIIGAIDNKTAAELVALRKHAGGNKDESERTQNLILSMKELMTGITQGRFAPIVAHAVGVFEAHVPALREPIGRARQQAFAAG